MSATPSSQNRARVTVATGGTLVLGGALFVSALFWASAQPDLPALAHGVCFAWFPRLLYLHAVSDGLIALAYYSIPVTLFYFAKKRKDLPYAWMFVLFGAFIIACGTTHLLDVWTIWRADYWTSGVVKALTAAVSLPTAVALSFMVPRALRLPSAEALRQANAALILEVQQRQRVEAQLRDMAASLERRVGERTAELQEANRLKDEFFAKVSHELRTPLQATLSWVQLLKRGGLEREGAQQALARIDHNVQAQARMVSDLLDTSRVLHGRLVLDVAPADLAQAVIRAVDMLRPQADAKAIVLDVEVCDGLDAVLTDAGRFEQVLWNLLTNAIQATPEQGRIRVRLARDGDDARLTVTDSGIGLTPEDMRVIFEPFEQVRGPGRSKTGLGLGLSIVQNIVGMLDGRIEVASDGPGLGATFAVTLPVQRYEPRGDGDGEAMHAQAAPLAGLRLLYVEDEPDVAQAMSLALATLGAQVASVASMREALDHARAHRLDVLVSDLDLGEGGSGNDLLRALRSQDTHVALPAVALSAYDDAATRAASEAAGFDAHLVKPAGAERVAEAVRDALTRRKSTD